MSATPPTPPTPPAPPRRADATDEARAGAALTVLGSGTLVPDHRHHGAAHLLRADPALVLMDCGPGTVHSFTKHDVAWFDLTHLLITHFHPDHVGDLPALMLALRLGVDPARTRSLTLVGPPGFRAFLERLADATGRRLLDPGFPLRVVELEADGGWSDETVGLDVRCVSTPHTEESVAYRVEAGPAVVGYTGDTGPSEAVARHLAGCDVLVAECTQPDPPTMDTHLSPSGLAALAAQARPGILAVTHVMPPLTHEEAAARVSDGYDGPVVPGQDGLVVPLPGRAGIRQAGGAR